MTRTADNARQGDNQAGAILPIDGNPLTYACCVRICAVDRIQELFQLKIFELGWFQRHIGLFFGHFRPISEVHR
jgi:hypothetical protein